MLGRSSSVAILLGSESKRSMTSRARKEGGEKECGEVKSISRRPCPESLAPFFPPFAPQPPRRSPLSRSPPSALWPVRTVLLRKLELLLRLRQTSTQEEERSSSTSLSFPLLSLRLPPPPPLPSKPLLLLPLRHLYRPTLLLKPTGTSSASRIRFLRTKRSSRRTLCSSEGSPTIPSSEEAGSDEGSFRWFIEQRRVEERSVSATFRRL